MSHSRLQRQDSDIETFTELMLWSHCRITLRGFGAASRLCIVQRDKAQSSLRLKTAAESRGNEGNIIVSIAKRPRQYREMDIRVPQIVCWFGGELGGYLPERVQRLMF